MSTRTPSSSEAPKPSDEVLRAYRDAGSPEEWLVNEVCTFLFDDVPADEINDRLEDFDQVMQAERDRLTELTPAPTEVVLFVISTFHGDHEEFISLREIPSAAFLLEVCSNVAEAGDLISFQVCYGDGSQQTRKVAWPFSMETAIDLTCPDGPRTKRAADVDMEFESASGPSSRTAEWLLDPSVRRAFGEYADDLDDERDDDLGDDLGDDLDDGYLDEAYLDAPSFSDGVFAGSTEIATTLTQAWQRVAVASWAAGAALGAALGLLWRGRDARR